MTNSLELQYDNLPLWMQQAQQKFDWGSVLIILFGILLAWNLTQQPNLLPNASQNYAFQTANIVQAFEEGNFYPRWSPNSLRGLGAPIPHFYPQGASYSAALLEVFFINDATLAVKYVTILMLSFSGLGLYKFLNIWFDVRKAWLSAFLYMFNPYIGFINPYITGDLAWIFVATLIPILLWVVSRLLLQGSNFNLFAVAFIVAGLLLTDLHGALLGLMTTCLLLVTVYWQLNKYPHENKLFTQILFKDNLILVFDGIVAGVMVSAFFWLPAFVERSTVEWQIIPSTIAEPLQWKELFSSIWSTQNFDTIPLTIGVILPLSAIIAFVIWLRAKYLTIQSGFLITGILSLFFVILFPSATWLLLLVVLSFAISGSLILDIAEKYSVVTQQIVFLGICGLILLLNVPQVRISALSNNSFTVNIDTQIDYEIREQTVATLPIGGELPSSVPYEFLPPFLFIRDVRQGDVNRVASNRFPTQVQVAQISSVNFQHVFQVQTAEEGLFVLYLAYFDGWEARLNGQRLRVIPNEFGLVEISVPANASGIIELRLSSTPTRTLSWIISGSTLIFLVIFMFWRQNRRQDQTPIMQTQNTVLNRTDLLGLGVALAIMIGLMYG